MSVIKFMAAMLLSLLLVPVAYSWGPGYGGYPGYGAPNPGQWSRGQDIRKGLHIEKTRDERGYVLKVHLSGIDPGAIEVQVVSGSLLLRSAQSGVTQQSGDYGRSFFSHSFSMNRRVRLPYDADASRMARSDSAGLIEIVLPVRSFY